MATYSEGRLSRWSRLKRTRTAQKQAGVEAANDPELSLSDGAENRAKAPGEEAGAPVKRTARPQAGVASWVDGKPFMAPLAAPEDDVSLRGIAATPLVPTAPEPEVPPSYEEDERELTEEEQEVVDALPPIDDLTPESDFSAFMQEKVPEFIRRKALRKLWLSDPVFSFLDGMNEYDEDYSILTELAAGATAYKPGEGYFGKPQVERDENGEVVKQSDKAEEKKTEVVATDGQGELDAETASRPNHKPGESTTNVRAPENKNAAYARPGKDVARFRDELQAKKDLDDDDVGDGEDDEV